MRRRRGLAGLEFGSRRRSFGLLSTTIAAAATTLAVSGAALVVTEEAVSIPGVSSEPAVGGAPESAAVPVRLSLDTTGFTRVLDRPPTEAGVRAARRYAERRDGEVSFAALAPGGALLAHGQERPYPSASLSKALLLVALLRQKEEAGAALDATTRAQLDSMITVSDNEAANEMDAAVEDASLAALADDAGMTRFEPAYWPNMQLTAADQARFFLRLDRLVPRQHRRYALDLLSSIAREQSWGVPDAAGRRWEVYFKGGWRPEGDGWLVTQGARLEARTGDPVAIAVLTRGNPSYVYGQETIEGVTRRVLDGD